MQVKGGDSGKTTSWRHINTTDLAASFGFTHLCDVSPESGFLFFNKTMTNAKRTFENVIQKACGRMHT